jgi:hypothetical protein
VFDGGYGLLRKSGEYTAVSDALPICGNGLAAVCAGGKYALMLVASADVSSPGYRGSKCKYAKEYGLAESIGLLDYLPSGCDYSETITRADFCRIVIALYNAVGGKTADLIGNPFTDCADSFVLEAYSLGLVNGRSVAKFCPDESITMQEVCTVVFRLKDLLNIALAEDSGAVPLGDVPVRAWAIEPVRFAVTRGLVNGASFQPEHSASAEEAMLVILNFAFSEVQD